jgi:hypothetical protein
VHNYDLQLVQQFTPRKWQNLTNRKVTMSITRLIIHIEDMAENINMGMTNMEEDTKEEETKEELARRNAMSISSLDIG